MRDQEQNPVEQPARPRGPAAPDMVGLDVLLDQSGFSADLSTSIPPSNTSLSSK